MKYQRDAFIAEIHRAAKQDPEIMFLSADFGAPALDAFREELPDQFVHCGISEQNMIDMAAGLALDGRKVYCYAMAPFVSLRCLEQHKCSSGIMNLPICTIVAGVGLGYADAGPTHYATEDLACLRAVVGSSVYTAADAETARQIALRSLERPEFSFVRLERQPVADVAPGVSREMLDAGYRRVRAGRRVAIVTQGYLLHRSVEVAAEFGEDVALFDLIRVKPFPEAFLRELASFETVLVLDEQTPQGGLAGAVMEALSDEGMDVRVRRVTLPERYFFENGGREKLLELGGLSPASIRSAVAGLLGN